MKINDILENNEITDTSHHKLITDPYVAYYYAREVIKGRWHEAEPIITKSPVDAYQYARDVIKGRWEEAEPIIMTDPGLVYCYANNVIKGRWLEAEPIIMTEPYWAHAYYTIVMIPSVLKSNPNSKQIFKLLMDITKYCNDDKSEYDDLIKQVFPDSSIMVDKWINYGNKQRGKK